MPQTIQLRRGTEAELTGVTLAEGEPGWISDLGQIVIGDGVTAGENLPRFSVGAGGQILAAGTFELEETPATVPSGLQKITPLNVETNVGNRYVDGVFTAPESGLYLALATAVLGTAVIAGNDSDQFTFAIGSGPSDREWFKSEPMENPGGFPAPISWDATLLHRQSGVQQMVGQAPISAFVFRSTSQTLQFMGGSSGGNSDWTGQFWIVRIA